MSFVILKHPPAARTDACEVSDANSSCSLAAAAGSARGSTVTVTTSAEAVASAIRRLSHHHMMSGNVCDGFELVRRPNNGRDITDSPIRSFEPRIRGVNGIVHSSTVPPFHDARGSIHVFMTHINTLDT